LRVRASTIWYAWSPAYLTYGRKCEELLNELARARPSGRIVVPARGKIEQLTLLEFDPRR